MGIYCDWPPFRISPKWSCQELQFLTFSHSRLVLIPTQITFFFVCLFCFCFVFSWPVNVSHFHWYHGVYSKYNNNDDGLICHYLTISKVKNELQCFSVLNGWSHNRYWVPTTDPSPWQLSPLMKIDEGCGIEQKASDNSHEGTLCQDCFVAVTGKLNILPLPACGKEEEASLLNGEINSPHKKCSV